MIMEIDITEDIILLWSIDCFIDSNFKIL